MKYRGTYVKLKILVDKGENMMIKSKE